MKKVIPKFYLPKKYPEDMQLLTKGLVESNGETLRTVISWLQSRLLSHEGATAGKPMARGTISNYLSGFYTLDLFRVDGNLYSDGEPRERASVNPSSKVEVIEPLKQTLQAKTLDSFNENLTQLCTNHSQVVKQYNSDRLILQEKHGLDRQPKPSRLQELLMKHCGYAYVGQPGVGYLDLFYLDKITIDDYLNLLAFIRKNYSETAQRNLGLIPIADILQSLKQVTDYSEDDFKSHLMQLHLTNRLELRTIKSQLANNIGIQLVEIGGTKYGFVKLLEAAVAV